MDKLIVTASPTGVPAHMTGHPDMSVARNQAQAVLDAYNAGASIAHIRGNRLAGAAGNAPDLDHWGELTSLVRAQSDIVVQFGASMMQPLVRRKLLDALHPEMGSFLLGHHHDNLFTYEHQRESARHHLQAGVLPEMEVFAPGNIWHMRKLIAEGLLQPPYFCSLLGFGRDTEDWSPTSMRQLEARLEPLPEGTVWTLGAEGPDQLKMQAYAISLGGHVNTGLEDEPPEIAPGRPAKSNADLVERVVRMARELGREVATPAEAREMLGLPRRPVI